MAYYAYLQNGYVAQVHVVADAILTDTEGILRESLGQEFLAGLYGYSLEHLVQCSIEGSFRFNYPGRGFTYDEARDAFIPPTPYPSWVLDEATCLWAAPIDYPADGGLYVWDEETTDWVEVQDETP